MLCDYGCGQEALYYSIWNKTHRCCKNSSSCPALKAKNAKTHKDSGIKPPNWSGRKHSDSSKDKISQRLMGNTNGNHRGDRHSFYNGVRMDSQWEVGTAKYFDANNIEWKYNERGYKLSDGRYYYPDFFIYENGIFVKLIEVKGYFRESNKLKFELFARDYPNIKIELWDKIHLGKLGIIDRSGYIV